MTATVSARKTASSIACVTSTVVVARSLQIRCSSTFIRSPGHLVERAERFVQQQDLRFHDQRPGDRDALPHATRKLVRMRPLEPPQPDQVDQVGDRSRPDPQAPDFQWQPDVGLDAAPGQERGILKRHPEAVPRAEHTRRFVWMSNLPLVGASRSASIRRIVDLPHPDGPSRATNSPRLAARLTPARA